MVVMMLSYHASGSRSERITFASGYQAICSRQKLQDGQSTDSTSEVLEQSGLPGLDYQVEADGGIYDAMNRGVQRSDTAFVYFLGADDRLLPGFMHLLDQLREERSVYYGNVLYSHDMKPYGGRFNRLKLVYRNICHQALIYPRSLLQAEPFNTDYNLYADWDMNIRLMAQVPFHYVRTDIAIFENTGGASARHKDLAFERNRDTVFLRHFGRFYYLASRTAPMAAKCYQALFGRRRPD